MHSSQNRSFARKSASLLSALSLVASLPLIASCSDSPDTIEAPTTDARESGAAAPADSAPIAAPDAAGEALAPAPNVLLRYTKKCAEGLTLDTCAGAYGIAFSSDGSYRVGPGPEGETIEGRLRDEDLGSFAHELLEQDIAALGVVAFQVESPIATSCVDQGGIDGEFQIQATFEEGTFPLVQAFAGKLCHRGLSVDGALRLTLLVDLLAQRYYPATFPDQCARLIGELQSAHGSALACNSHDECAFANENYAPITEKGPHLVNVSGCAGLTPLVVANKEVLVREQSNLVALSQRVRDACGPEGQGLESCGGSFGFRILASAPRCESNRCVLPDN